MHLLLGLAMRKVPAPFSLYIVTACHTHWFAHKSDSEILLLSRNRFGASSVHNSDFQEWFLRSIDGMGTLVRAAINVFCMCACTRMHAS